MATTTNKQRLLTQFFSALKDGAGDGGAEEGRPVFEQFVYGICRENATREQADAAFAGLRARFFDWNEVRVSSPREVEEALADLPDAELRAERIVSFLQEVFEATYSFDLEGLHKKGVKQAAKALSRYQAANDYIISWVVQQSLGGHAVPVDAPTLRCARRLGLLDTEIEDREALRTSLEHLVPKAKGSAFTDLVSVLGTEYCWEADPNCSACPLASECPTAQEAGVEVVTAARATRHKPR